MTLTIIECGGKPRQVECESFEFRGNQATNWIRIKKADGCEALIHNVCVIKTQEESEEQGMSEEISREEIAALLARESEEMTNEEAVMKIKARLECMTRNVSGVNCDCNAGRCVECRLNYEQGNMGEQIEYLRMAIKALEQEPKTGRWIPVSEKLPKEGKTVIASTKYGVYPEAKYTKEYGWEWAYEAGADYWVELENVTAWMPLPEPYKAESEE